MTSIRLSALRVALPALIAFFPVQSPAASEPVAVTECGQVLKGSGYLTADLDCSGQNVNEHTVVIGKGGTLDLAGFTLTGRVTEELPNFNFVETVACRRGCTILGPGTIIGSPTGPGSVVGFDKWEDGKRINVINATITGGAIGVNARRVDLDGATVTGNRNVGVWAFFARISNSTITGNGLGADGLVRIGVFGQVKSRVENSTVTGNGMGGIEGWRVRIDNTTATGNNAFADCATRVCADLSSRFVMRLRGTSTCDHSLYEGTFDQPGSWIGQPLPAIVQNWGVCSLD